MTTQHAPHTPLPRRVLSVPHTRLGWWAIALTVGSVLLLIFGGISGGISSVVADPVLVIMIFIAGLLPGAVVGLIALLRSQEERSVLVWLAMVPVALVAAVPIAFMAMFMRHEVRYDLSYGIRLKGARTSCRLGPPMVVGEARDQLGLIEQLYAPVQERLLDLLDLLEEPVG